ncbi:MAG: ferrous iron transporter B [Clostridiales bacterium]|nr:ferrous iron transporter B [Clostridiales bacterium]
MGLTRNAAIINTSDNELEIIKKSPKDKVIALAGNPNVGKSSIFNALTGLNQHTGNWPGKTISHAQGYCSTEKNSYVLVDLPGTYSLMAHSAEEEVARDFICFGNPDVIIVVCDATCLEHNLNLVLQTIEISSKVIVCVNLMDEAQHKKIHINLALLSKRLGVPVIGTSARKKETLQGLLDALDVMTSHCKSISTDSKTISSENTVSNETPLSGKNKTEKKSTPLKIHYPKDIEHAIQVIEPMIEEKVNGQINSRWLSLKLLHHDASHLVALDRYLGKDFLRDPELLQGITVARKQLAKDMADVEHLDDQIVQAILNIAEKISGEVVTCQKDSYHKTDLAIDKILTSRLTGFPVMLLLLALIFWITIVGANILSDWLADILFWIQDGLTVLFTWAHTPDWLYGLLVLGLYRTLAWVISVMLPPMAIFFPLFTLLEDSGYLPRIAYNLDKPFQCCHACGKQALTMCMDV